MNLAPLTDWAHTNPWPATVAGTVVCVLLVGAVWCTARAIRTAERPEIVIAAVAAAGCTAYSADTSWRFAAHRLGMDDLRERAAMFAVAELALIACAVLARATKRATADDEQAGTAGVAGALVWCIVTVQVIPAFTESGFWAGVVRAFFGPICAGLLWHMAMGLEIRVLRPGALSTGLPALIGRELRQRLLSLLGLGVRDRTAAQITRDRATARAVRLASRKRLFPWGRSRLRAAVATAGVGANADQLHKLMRLLAARRGAGQLAKIELPSPWTVEEQAPVSAPPTLLGIAGREMRQMHPVDAVHLVRDALPDAHPGVIAAVLTGHGIVASETTVNIALREQREQREPVHPPALEGASAAGQRRRRVEVQLPPDDERDAEEPGASGDEDARLDDEDVPDPDPRIGEARALDVKHRAANGGKCISMRALQREMQIGQKRAQSLRAQLDAS